jgi:hypothetical protein
MYQSLHEVYGEASFRECVFEWLSMILNEREGVEIINELVIQ